jgi:hypothetical protein
MERVERYFATSTSHPVRGGGRSNSPQTPQTGNANKPILTYPPYLESVRYLKSPGTGRRYANKPINPYAHTTLQPLYLVYLVDLVYVI